MASTTLLTLVAFVGLCSAAPNYVIPSGDSVIVNYNIDADAQAASVAERIVGGTATTINAYPWIAQLEFFTGVWNQACAANILTPSYVLSAAHCTHTHTDPFYRPENRRIRAGATNRNTGGSIRAIRVLNHPSYNPTSSLQRNNADISLLRLAVALTLGSTIQSISIPPHNHVLPDNAAVVHAGWGAISTGGPVSNKLHHVTVNSINIELCKQRYASANPPLTVNNNMICAGILNVGGRDTCQGDAGGPLIYGRTLVGVISSSEYCADSVYPGVNTRVASYTNWIVSNVV